MSTLRQFGSPHEEVIKRVCFCNDVIVVIDHAGGVSVVCSEEGTIIEIEYGKVGLEYSEM